MVASLVSSVIRTAAFSTKKTGRRGPARKRDLVAGALSRRDVAHAVPCCALALQAGPPPLERRTSSGERGGTDTQCAPPHSTLRCTTPSGSRAPLHSGARNGVA